MNLEVLIPVRNPTEVFRKTAESLTAQTNRNFSVLISDNFSTQGREHLDHVLARLQDAGITACRIQPPAELGRVEHWNWLHYESGADWVKPLFAGDWLDDGYIAAVHDAIRAEAKCVYVYCGYHYHREDDPQPQVPEQRGRRFYSAIEMQERVMRFGMQFGPPSVAAYRRDAFLKGGAYDPSLPICADSVFFCKLAARNGGFQINDRLVHFVIHGARFSTVLPEKKRDMFRETWRYFVDLGITAWHERWRFPKFGYLRLWLRSFRDRLRSTK